MRFTHFHLLNEVYLAVLQPVDDFRALLYHKGQVVNEFVWGSVFLEEEELNYISKQVVWVFFFIFLF